jgi:hypothetical protein
VTAVGAASEIRLSIGSPGRPKVVVSIDLPVQVPRFQVFRSLNDDAGKR